MTASEEEKREPELWAKQACVPCSAFRVPEDDDAKVWQALAQPADHIQNP
jgi:hypothetical protein